ncbi:MAG: hypothetical protein QOH58_381 [Thermoleophilaceae bacterium]|nr:hypothetical protein [Thermoleophilaceae bacterium]
MDYEQFVTLVEQDLEVGREPAERAIRATLQTLAERIAQGEARDLAEELPDELGPWVATTTPAERFDVDEFLRRLAEREGVEVPEAERHARAVFAVLGQAVSRKQLHDLAAELPKDYAPLLPVGPQVEVLSPATFLQRVADRAAVHEDDARRATEAVLETLAERIAGGEVDDLIARLPVELHEPLKRGRERSGEKSTRMSLDEFVEHVAERAGVSTEQARDYVRAVLKTLREAVGDDEFFDVAAQLPSEYDQVLAVR